MFWRDGHPVNFLLFYIFMGNLFGIKNISRSEIVPDLMPEMDLGILLFLEYPRFNNY